MTYSMKTGSETSQCVQVLILSSQE